MLEGILTRALRLVFGGGAAISAANPLPVDLTPGDKTVSTILNRASIALSTTTTLAHCIAINLLNGPIYLTLTVKARYNAAAVAGIRIHVRTSPTNQASGIHTAANHLTIMTDAAAHFIVNELVGLTINNVTDGSSGVVTANTETTVTVAALVGGTLNRWTTGDAYTIPGADYDTVDWDMWTPAFAAGLPVRQTETYDISPAYIKVLVENLDAGQAVIDVQVVATRGA